MLRKAICSSQETQLEQSSICWRIVSGNEWISTRYKENSLVETEDVRASRCVIEEDVDWKWSPTTKVLPAGGGKLLHARIGGGEGGRSTAPCLNLNLSAA